jgi:hypothetical protein
MSAEPRADGDDGRIALETGLERVRLMILAEEESAEVRRTWDGLDKDNITDDTSRRKLEEIRIQVDSLPTAPESDPPQPTPSIQIQTS